MLIYKYYLILYILNYASSPFQLWSIMIFALILVSIAVVVMETHPWFRVPRTDNSTDFFNITSTRNEKVRMFSQTRMHPVLNYLDGCCVSVFAIELLLRFITCPSKVNFFKSGYNLIDTFCVLPLVAYYIVQLVDSTLFYTLLMGSGAKMVVVMIYLSVSSVLRVFRLFKLARHYRALKLLHLAVGSSLKELSLLLLLISIGTLIFSTLIYFAEFQVADGKFKHIPIGFWWSTITMTTVGYGDMVPKGTWGYVVGIVCAISGMLITGLPIPIIANNFNRYYTYAKLTTQLAEKLKKEKKVWKGTPDDSKPHNHRPASCRSCVQTSIRSGTTTSGSGTMSVDSAISSQPAHTTRHTHFRNNRVADNGYRNRSIRTSHRSDTLTQVSG